MEISPPEAQRSGFSLTLNLRCSFDMCLLSVILTKIHFFHQLKPGILLENLTLLPFSQFNETTQRPVTRPALTKIHLLAFYSFVFSLNSNCFKLILFSPCAILRLRKFLLGARVFAPRMRTSVPGFSARKMADVSLDELIRRRNFNIRGGLKRYATLSLT